MGSSNLDIGAVLRDPDFLGLSTIEKRKFLLDADPDFAGLPVAEQSNFIVSLTSPLFEPRSSVWKERGIGGPVGAIAARAGKQVVEDIREQITPTPESLAGPVGTPLRAVVDTAQFVRRGLKQPLGETAKQFALSPIPIPVEKLGTQIGTGKIPEALGTAALTGAEFAGLGALGKAHQAKPLKGQMPEPVVINEQLGQAMQSYLDKANVAIGKEIGKHVDNIVSAVDDPVRNPMRAIDASSKVKALQEGFEAYDKTLTDMNLKPDAAIKKTVEEAIQSPRWSWAQAKDVRTALMDMQRKAGTRMSAAVSKAIGELTDELRSTAKAAGVEADFTAYNTLARQRGYIQEQFLDNVLDAPSGTDVMSALTGTKEGPVKINLPALKSYGVDPAVVSDAIAFSKRLKAKAGGEWWKGWGARSVGAHAAMALGIPYSAGWFGVEALQALKGRGKSPVGESGTALVEGERIAKGRMPIPPSEVATPTEVPVKPYPPRGVAGESRQHLLPPVPKVGATPEVPTEAPSAPSFTLPKPTAFQREVAKRDALTDLRKNLRIPSAEGKAWLESKGVDFEKPGALAEAHRVINEELARLTGKGKKAATKKEPLPPVPKLKTKPPEGGTPPSGAAPVKQAAPETKPVIEKAPEVKQAVMERPARTDQIGSSYKPPAPESPLDIQDFASDESPMRTAKVRDALTKNLVNRDRVISRKDLVEEKVAEGARVEVAKNGERRLMAPDGSYLAESQISKTAMDYADFLANKSAPNVAPESILKTPAAEAKAAPKPSPTGEVPAPRSARAGGAESVGAEPSGAAKSVPGAMKIGDNIRIMKVESTLAKITEADNGVRYELFNDAGLKGKGGSVIVRDMDSGNTVTVRRYPTYDAAEAAYNAAIKGEGLSTPAPKGAFKQAMKERGEKVFQETRAKFAEEESKAPITITASLEEKSKINYGGKVSKRTGLNPTQEDFLAQKLREVAPTLKQPLKISYQPGYKAPPETPPPPVTISVPGDGRFTVASDKAASRLHSQITGKPIEGAAAFEKKGKGSFRASPKEWTAKADVARAIDMYGTASKALQFLKRQLETIKDLPETESTWQLESVISELEKLSESGKVLPTVPKPRSTQ